MNSRMNRISEKEEILNKIPIFLAKTYQIVDVRHWIFRILPIQILLSGIWKAMH